MAFNTTTTVNAGPAAQGLNRALSGHTTLEEVLQFYAAGGRNITSGLHAGDGRANPNKNDFINQIALTADDRADLLAFLKTLTDHELLTNPRLADPFARQAGQ